MVAELLHSLTRHARAAGWNDRQWAARAGVRPETLCRVRRRGHCDAATLDALAQACGLQLVAEPARCVTDDGLFPATFGRDAEEELLQLALSGSIDIARWRRTGPAFFMAGFAFFLACADEGDREAYTKLAEDLHPGVSSHDAFRRWLRQSPVRASRFLPMLGHLRKARNSMNDREYVAP